MPPAILLDWSRGQGGFYITYFFMTGPLPGPSWYNADGPTATPERGIRKRPILSLDENATGLSPGISDLNVGKAILNTSIISYESFLF